MILLRFDFFLSQIRFANCLSSGHLAVEKKSRSENTAIREFLEGKGQPHSVNVAGTENAS